MKRGLGQKGVSTREVFKKKKRDSREGREGCTFYSRKFDFLLRLGVHLCLLCTPRLQINFVIMGCKVCVNEDMLGFFLHIA